MSAGVRWVSCSQEASYAASRHRHLAKPGALTTVCGASASHASVWRGNTTKPQCPTCLRVAANDGVETPIEAIAREAVQELEEVAARVTAPEVPDWHARYRGYAYRQIVKTRNIMASELARDVERRHKSAAELERQAARLASYTELIDTLDALKGMLK